MADKVWELKGRDETEQAGRLGVDLSTDPDAR